MNNLYAQNIAKAIITVYTIGTLTAPQVKLDPIEKPYYVYDDTRQNSANSFTSTLSNLLVPEKSMDVKKCINLATLDSIAQLEEDWDGYNATPFSERSIRYFKSVVENLNKQPTITPAADNSIVLEYSAKDDSVLFYNVSIEKTEKVYIPQGNIEEIENCVIPRDEDLAEAINNDVEIINGL